MGAPRGNKNAAGPRTGRSRRTATATSRGVRKKVSYGRGPARAPYRTPTIAEIMTSKPMKRNSRRMA